jgi:Fe2+ transport system protein FeoA
VNDSFPACLTPDACRQGDVCPFNRVKAGTAVRIKQLVAAPEVSHRLRELGFCEEQQVKLVSHQVNVICQVCHARVGELRTGRIDPRSTSFSRGASRGGVTMPPMFNRWLPEGRQLRNHF